MPEHPPSITANKGKTKRSTTISIRHAEPSDAPAMVELLNAIIAKGGTTAHESPFSIDTMMQQYITPPSSFAISCLVAVDSTKENTIMGFQALEWADPDWSNSGKSNYEQEDDHDILDASWTIIATFVSLEHHGQGVGRSLFEATLDAARLAGVGKVDATVRLYNTGGQAFYNRMGFVDYKRTNTSISKRYDLPMKEVEEVTREKVNSKQGRDGGCNGI